MIVTTEIRIKDKTFANYLGERAVEESKIIIYAINRMGRPDFRERYQNKSKFNTHLCEKFGILSRTANSIINYVEGAIKGYREFKKFELEDKKLKLESAKKKLESRKQERDFLKKIAAENALTKKQKKRLKNLNQSIYHLNNRINRIRQKIKSLKRIIKNGEVHISFGGRGLFKKQFHLEENGYKTHEEWKRDFRAQRARMIFSVGRAAEKGGNQIVCFSINPNNGTLTLRYRKEHVKKGEEKYLYCENMILKYLKEPFYEILKKPGSQAVCARFLKRKTKWFVQIIFDLPAASVVTSNEAGVCSLDYNDGFIQLGELDEHANLVRLEEYSLFSRYG